jgi:hypothetical protein
MVVVAIIAGSCGGKTTTPAKTSTPEGQRGLSVVDSWSVDDTTHLEPMVVPGVKATLPNTLFVAYIASDSGQGPAKGGPPLDGKVQSVTGGGLTWTRQAEAHLAVTAEPSIAEIWTASTASPIKPFTVTVTRNNNNGAVTYCDNYEGGSGPDIANGMVLVQAVTGANLKNPVGSKAVAGVGKTSGRVAPASVTLAATRAGSLVSAVGADWSESEARTLPSGQKMIHEDVSTSNGDTYWVQGLAGPVNTPGPVTLSVTEPTQDDCNMAAVEIMPAP